jgi:hypothetical protein
LRVAMVVEVLVVRPTQQELMELQAQVVEVAE